jgi:hypothetical protein
MSPSHRMPRRVQSRGRCSVTPVQRMPLTLMWPHMKVRHRRRAHPEFVGGAHKDRFKAAAASSTGCRPWRPAAMKPWSGRANRRWRCRRWTDVSGRIPRATPQRLEPRVKLREARQGRPADRDCRRRITGARLAVMLQAGREQFVLNGLPRARSHPARGRRHRY